MRCLYDPELDAYGVYSTMMLSEDNSYVDSLTWTLLDGACQGPPVKKIPSSWDFETEEELLQMTKGRYPSSPPKTVKVKVETTQAPMNSSILGQVKSRFTSTVRRVTRGFGKAIQNLVAKPFKPPSGVKLIGDENTPKFAWSYDPVKGEMEVGSLHDFQASFKDHSSREESVEPFRKKKSGILFPSGIFSSLSNNKPKDVNHLMRMTNGKKRGLAYVLIDGKFEKRLF